MDFSYRYLADILHKGYELNINYDTVFLSKNNVSKLISEMLPNEKNNIEIGDCTLYIDGFRLKVIVNNDMQAVIDSEKYATMIPLPDFSKFVPIENAINFITQFNKEKIKYLKDYKVIFEINE